MLLGECRLIDPLVGLIPSGLIAFDVSDWLEEAPGIDLFGSQYWYQNIVIPHSGHEVICRLSEKLGYKPV